MATYDTWGGSWGTSWALSWTREQPIPPTPGSSAGGGAGRPIYRQRRWPKDILEDGLKSAYQEIMGMDLSGEVVLATTKLVKPFADKQARFKKIPKADEIDWKGMHRDLDLSRQLIQIHTDYVAKVALEREIEEEDEFLLLH